MKNTMRQLVELAYRFDDDLSGWLGTLSEAAASLTPGGEGAMAYAFDASVRGEGVHIGEWGAADVSDDFVESTLELNGRTRLPESDLFYRSGVTSGTVTEFLRKIGRSASDHEVYSETSAARGYPDIFGLTASAPDYRGVVINAPLRSETSLDERTRLRWRQFGAHLQTAYRLRNFIERETDVAEAVLEPGGRVVDATGEARTASRREWLVRAVQHIEQTRNGAYDPDAGLDMWTALVDGRWSLIENFDTDGRRFYLAVPNSCETRELFALTDRERQVVAHVAQGDSNKWVAYQLGVSAATVSTLLQRASEKLNVDSRQELIVLYHRLRSVNKRATS